LFLQYSSEHRTRSLILTIKEQVQPGLSLNQDRWRAWSMLGLTDVLNEDLAAFSRLHPNVSVSIVPRKQAIASEMEIVIPMEVGENEPVVLAKILAGTFTSQNQVSEYATAAALLLGFLFVVSLLLSTYLIRKHIQTPLKLLRQRVAQLDLTGEFTVRDIAAIGEIKGLLDLIANLHERTKESEKLSAVGEVAQQVAHDIRSPLCALNLAVSSANTLPESQRRLIQAAVVRINDIANNLDGKRSIGLWKTGARPLEDAPRPQYMLSMLREVLAQKRTEFSTGAGISLLETSLNQITRTFACVDPVAFKTLTSNLFNNARESISRNGAIELSVDVSEAGFLKLSVSDNGKGIPANILPRLTERGFSNGKYNGSGLGLYHAAESLKKWNGSLSIQSKEGVGTRVTVKIPTTTPPAWFHAEIELPSGSEVAVVDDDPSIHELWKFRIAANEASGISLNHFFSLAQFKLWMTEKADRRGGIYLVDQEFVGHKESGLDAIRELGICASSYLVTSRSDDPELLSWCLQSNVRVIPKCTAEYISISVPTTTAGEIYA
jgi:signal transduction histidine kinase